MNMNDSQPHLIESNLIESNLKMVVNYTLKKCHDIKIHYYNFIYNSVLFLIFIIILSAVLIVKYKGKPSAEEIKNRQDEKQKYILNKIKQFQENTRKEKQQLIQGTENLITWLPYF